MSKAHGSDPIDHVRGDDRDFSEADHLADIVGKLQESVSDDFALEEHVWFDDDTRGRKDISAKRMGKLVAIIEVKRPAQFANQKLQVEASEQVIKYARREGCRNVAWTDGTTFVSKDLITEEVVNGELIGVAKGIYGWEARQTPTFLRPQWKPNELLQFPERQRDLHLRLVSPEFYIARDLPNGPLSRLLSSPATLHIILRRLRRREVHASASPPKAICGTQSISSLSCLSLTSNRQLQVKSPHCTGVQRRSRHLSSV